MGLLTVRLPPPPRAWLAAAALALVAGCYDPDLRDCAVACTNGDECGPGQVCGDDGLCASPDVAGTCDQPPGADARPPDAPPAVTLRLEIERKGRLVVEDPASTCESDENGGTSCTVALPSPQWVDVDAIATDEPFERWTTSNCTGSQPTCRVFAGPGTTTIGARFEN